MRSIRVRGLPLLLLLVLAACVSSAGRQHQRDEPVTRVRVDNRSFTGYTIYVLDGKIRTRLGRVDATSEATFVIPPNLLFGPTPLQFEIAPLASNDRPHSQVIQVNPGETVTLLIPR
ncbi:MAG TPA: hypothetical protein VFK13_07225 [Gemmatimonadaceae bacterium]|nr:hypothetical protein [Gemmatimonadaceae bacterium]